MNQLIIIGNLVKDPEARTTPNGKNVCKFRVAVNEQGKDKPTMFNVDAWGNLGEVCFTYLKKGLKVAAVGRASVKPYVGKDGSAYGDITLTASSVEFLSKVRDVVEKMKESDDLDLSDVDIPY